MDPTTLPRCTRVLTLVLPLLLAACGADAPPPQARTPEVTVVTLSSQPIAMTRELAGRIQPFLVAEVRPQVTGLVAKQLFTEGSRVEAGAALYQLDDATYRAEVQSAQAAVARAQATLTAAKAASARSERLVKTHVISAQDHENATAALQQAQAEVGVARAALESARITLGYARITAPISGRIGKSSVTQGALVTANQSNALATVQQLDPIYVDLTQSSSEWLQLRKEFAAGTLEKSENVPVTIRLEDGSTYAQAGHLAFSDVSVNPDTGSYLLRVIVPNPDNLLLPGMYVRAVVSNGERSDGLLVPQEGVTRNAKGDATAMVVGADNTVEQRVVEVSRTEGAHWVVESGLSAGDRVVVEGLQKIRPGAQVTAVERDATNVATPEASPPSGNAG